jgi:hypothetical protein
MKSSRIYTLNSILRPIFFYVSLKSMLLFKVSKNVCFLKLHALQVDKHHPPTKLIIVPSSLKSLVPRTCGFGVVNLACHVVTMTF